MSTSLAAWPELIASLILHPAFKFRIRKVHNFGSLVPAEVSLASFREHRQPWRIGVNIVCSVSDVWEAESKMLHKFPFMVQGSDV